MTIDDESLDVLFAEVDEEVQPVYRSIERVSLHNHTKVLQAFLDARVSAFHLFGSTGYGYDDLGRDALEQVYAAAFSGEAALVREQFVSGTHTIASCLFGVLRPGDCLLSVQGEPYDTLCKVIGFRERYGGSLRDFGVSYRQVDLLADGTIDYLGVADALEEKTTAVLLQRSKGYRWGPSFSIGEMKKVIALIKQIQPDTIIIVDNCYGEFVETQEPTEAGADLVAGSLIKNPGGGLAPSGGYVVGKEQYVAAAANHWSAPGIGAAVGPAPFGWRLLFQGFFQAPHVVAESLKGMVFASRLFERLGFPVQPEYRDERSDIVQAIGLGTSEKLIAFCRGIQGASPIDAHVRPEPDEMPGYEDPVIMAAGTFIQGASLELSADGPLRKPYAVYLQGGLSKEYVKIALANAVRELYS